MGRNARVSFRTSHFGGTGLLRGAAAAGFGWGWGGSGSSPAPETAQTHRVGYG